MADDGTAEPVLDYLASGGHGGEWTRFADLAGRESLYNLGGVKAKGEHMTPHTTGLSAGDRPLALPGKRSDRLGCTRWPPPSSFARPTPRGPVPAGKRSRPPGRARARTL